MRSRDGQSDGRPGARIAATAAQGHGGRLPIIRASVIVALPLCRFGGVLAEALAVAYLPETPPHASRTRSMILIRFLRDMPPPRRQGSKLFRFSAKAKSPVRLRQVLRYGVVLCRLDSGFLIVLKLCGPLPWSSHHACLRDSGCPAGLRRLRLRGLWRSSLGAGMETLPTRR